MRLWQFYRLRLPGGFNLQKGREEYNTPQRLLTAGHQRVCISPQGICKLLSAIKLHTSQWAHIVVQSNWCITHFNEHNYNVAGKGQSSSATTVSHCPVHHVWYDDIETVCDLFYTGWHWATMSAYFYRGSLSPLAVVWLPLHTDRLYEREGLCHEVCVPSQQLYHGL
jgi:hypothetical protein